MKNFSIQYKVYGIFFLLLFVMFCSAFIIFESIDKAKEDAKLLNALGRQRVLVETMSKSAQSYVVAKNRRKAIEEQVFSLNQYITEMRKTYTQEVIVPAQKANLEISMEKFDGTHITLPFPASFTRMVNEKFDKYSSLKIDIISEQPVNPLKGLISELDHEASSYLKENPDKIFSKVFERDKKLLVGFYTADKATTTACASCHSQIRNTTVKIGDTLGIRKYQVVYAENVAVGRFELDAGLDEYETAKKIYQQTLMAIKSGGEYPLDMAATTMHRIDPIRDLKIIETIKETEYKLQEFSSTIGQLVNLSFSHPVFREAALKIVKDTDELLNLSNDLVNRYTEIANRNQKNISRATAFSWLFALVSLAGTALFLTRTVIKPVRRISAVLSETAQGNLSQEILAVRSKDEIGMLHKSCNVLTRGLQKFIRASEEILSGKTLENKFGLPGEFQDSIERMLTQARERKRAEEELRVSQKKLAHSEIQTRTVLENVVDGIITISTQGIVQTFNPAAERIFGYSPNEVIGQNVKMLMDEPYREEHDGYLKNYLQTGQAKIIGMTRELSGHRKDGSVFPLELAVSEMYMGEQRFFSGIVRDISERKKVEEELRHHRDHLEEAVQERTADYLAANEKLLGEIAKRQAMGEDLRETNEFLQNILESPSEISIISTDKEGNILYWNQGAANLLGYTAREMVGRQNIDVLYPDDPETKKTIQNAIAAIYEHKKNTVCEVEEVTRAGEKIWVKLTLSARTDESGNMVGILGIGENVTQQKQAQEKLRLSEERSRMIISTAPEAFISINDKSEIIEWNAEAEKIFGWEKAEVLGKALDELIIPEVSREAHKKGLEKFLKSGVGPILNQRIELSALNRKGHEFPIEISISPLRHEESYFFNAFIQDISERKQMQAQLNHTQKLESIGRLAAGIAHEMNTPLQYIGDNTRFLKDSLNDLLPLIKEYDQVLSNSKDGKIPADLMAKLKEMVEEADIDFLLDEIPQAIDQSLEGVGRVSKIVQAMKEFSHPGTEEKKPCALNKAIETTLDVSRNEWKYVADMKTDLDPKLPLVPVFANDFNQIILNIVVNAAHAIEESLGKEEGKKGTITITTGQKDNWAEILIRDTGNGIPEDIRDRIFDPFFTTKEVGKGTGQGLSLVHAMVVKKHQGTITVDTEPGKGTTFTIRLPLALES